MDIDLILEVNFRNGQHGEYTENELKLTFNRGETVKLRDHFVAVTNQREESHGGGSDYEKDYGRT